VILLDTHVLLWHTKGLETLGVRAQQLADEALSQNELVVLAITFWEVGRLYRRDDST
jgi:PIN domain nuclease of toxin-antitoxin system